MLKNNSMKKTLRLLLTLSIVSITQAKAQSISMPPSTANPDSAIELRFQLTEEKSSGQLALDVQLINHLTKDVFIPNINFFTFHLYEQSDSGWNELDLFTHRVYPKGDSSP